jgi:hypothetical protein
MAEIEERERTAIDIAVKAGAIKRCEFHGEVLEASGDHVYAYRVGNSMMTRGELNGVFDSPQQMAGAVKAAIDGAGLECCSCDRLLED